LALGTGLGTVAETWNGASKTTSKINDKKNRIKNSLYPLRHFTEQLVGAFRKPPWEYNLDRESSSLLNRQLKSNTGNPLPTNHTEIHQKSTQENESQINTKEQSKKDQTV
jgi:hypothetical protein